VEYRERRGVRSDLCRLVWSESDGLPGVIVDRYGATLVLQTLTLAMDQRKELIVGAMKAALGATNVIERNDAAVRRAEGLEQQVGILRGNPEPQVEFDVAGVRMTTDLINAQKAGFYLDQLPHYAAVAEHARGKRVLDCFTSQGAFALACAKAGASDATAVEASAESIVAARANADRNALNVTWIEQDVFQFLRSAEKAEAQFDLVVLDPPSFTKTKGGLHAAMRGYRELHVRAFKLLSKDGVLATFSCSHHVSEQLFAETIADALVDARRSARQLRRFEQAIDHPVLPTIPETQYFKGLLLEMMPGR
jgi:23S rRNA (cytosine1962-C5)-methyltransferase